MTSSVNKELYNQVIKTNVLYGTAQKNTIMETHNTMGYTLFQWFTLDILTVSNFATKPTSTH